MSPRDATAGHSGTPLAKKLGYKPGHRALWLDTPPDYPDLLGQLPDNVAINFGPIAPPYDLVHLFVPSTYALKRLLPVARAATGPKGIIWVSWHKQASKIPTDVTEDTVRALAHGADLIDVKVCAVSDLWSGLKLTARKAARSGATRQFRG